MKTVVKVLFVPWYHDGRTLVGINPGQADELLSLGCMASYEAGAVTITDPAGQFGPKYYAVNKHLHRKKIIAWVDGFNKRARAARP